MASPNPGISQKIAELESGIVTPAMVSDAFSGIAKGINCANANTTDEESRVIAKHVSNLLRPLDGKVLSLIILVLFIALKLWVCWHAVMHKLGKDKA